MSTSSEAAADERIVAKCYVELGNVTKEKGDYDESLSYHRRSMEIYERIDDPLGLADSHLNLGEIYKAKGELKQAMSEYEKGLSIYEDVYVDDANKNSDSGTDVSLNSSSFCDPQHVRSLSKSEEILSHGALLAAFEKNGSPVSSLNPVNTSTRNASDAPRLASSVDDSALVLSRKLSDTMLKSLASSRASDLQNLDDPDLFSPISPSDSPDENEFNPSYESFSQYRLTNDNPPAPPNNAVSHRYCIAPAPLINSLHLQAVTNDYRQVRNVTSSRWLNLSGTLIRMIPIGLACLVFQPNTSS